MNPSIVLVQPRKTRPFIIERLLMGRKGSNQTNKIVRTYLQNFNIMDGSRKFHQGGPDVFFLSHQRISQRAIQTSLQKQLDLRGPIAS